MMISSSPKIRGSDAVMNVDGWDRNIRALLTAFSGVTGKLRSGMLTPTNINAYPSPWPGKLPARGVKPWMYLLFQAGLVWVSRYWM
jgi:hypothetical protein